MTEREILILAAKVAEIELPEYWDFCQSTARTFWNPLRDDGDAFRLAVKCLPFYKLTYNRDEWESSGQNGYAAARLAIVNAAIAKGNTYDQ